MDTTFEPIGYLSSLTSFTFDKEVLKRIAIENELDKVRRQDDIDDEQKDMCLIALLQTALDGPWSSASQTNKHGDFSVQVGSQTMTAADKERTQRRLNALKKKWGLEVEDTGELAWVGEDDFEEYF